MTERGDEVFAADVNGLVGNKENLHCRLFACGLPFWVGANNFRRYRNLQVGDFRRAEFGLVELLKVLCGRRLELVPVRGNFSRLLWLSLVTSVLLLYL